MITLEEMGRIMPLTRSRAGEFLSPINAAMDEHEIYGPQRISAFIAQVAHESGELRYTREIADGSAYEGRKDLGNTVEGDGCRFRGRGLFQVTGRNNYISCSYALYGDERLLEQPELLENPYNAAMSAAWFWDTHNLNKLADKEDFRGITKVINGGYNGYASRLEYYNRAKHVLGADQ